jgi:hypothetical protein
MIKTDKAMVTARDMPPIKASRLVGFLIDFAYYTGKIYKSGQTFKSDLFNV